MNQNNKILIAASLANGSCFSMILPILAPLVRQMKMTELQGGALISAGALLMAIGAIYISKQQNKYSIYSYNGKLIKESDINSKNVQLNLHYLLLGIYIIKLETSMGIISKRIFKN